MHIHKLFSYCYFFSVPPVIKDDVSSVTAVKMSPVVLPCHATGRPDPVISWNKNWMQLGARGGSYRVLPTGESETNFYHKLHTSAITDIPKPVL